MKKQLIVILFILAAAVFGGWKILHLKPREPHGKEQKEKAKEDEHGKESRVTLSPESLKNANLKLAETGPAKIKILLPLYGKVAVNDEAMAHVQPRFPGIVKEVRKRLGERVAKGDLLAVVESNDSLRSYEIKSEIAGMVIEKKISIGEFVKNEDTIFTVADLSTVWVDLSVFRRDFALLKEGQAVLIHAGEGTKAIESKISYISPFGTEDTQTMLARCEVPNPKGDLRPGLFITAEIITGEVDSAITVRLAALQTLKEKTVVFVQEGEAFEAREVELGVKDGALVQVLSGVKAGEKYVAENSFILKSELLKSEMEAD